MIVKSVKNLEKANSRIWMKLYSFVVHRKVPHENSLHHSSIAVKFWTVECPKDNRIVQIFIIRECLVSMHVKLN